jgi:hypothetical protein
MADQADQIAELLSAPMEAVIIALGTGIAKAQQELDRYAIQTQRQIDEDPFLSESGIQATFYQFPHAELELTMAIAMEDAQASSPGVAATAAVNPLAAQILQPFRLKQLYFQPVNARYTNHFSYDVNAASKIKLTIVPVPPTVTDSTNPLLSRDEVVAKAMPLLVKEGNTDNLPSDARLTVNFNGRTRSWFVLEYRLQNNEISRMALVVVDDVTGQVVKSAVDV